MVTTREWDRLRLAVFASMLLGGAVITAVIVSPLRGDIVETVTGFGTAAPLAFVVLYAVLSLLLVPGALLSLAAGALFGAVLGGALAVIGGAVGSIVAFFAGRRLGREQVERVAGSRMEAIDRRLRRHGVTTVIVVRIAPLVPYNVLNYAAGVTGIGTRDYVLGTAMGLVPGAFAYAAVGSGLDTPASLEFIGGLGLVAAMLVAGRLLDRRTHREDEHAGGPAHGE